MAGTLFYVYTDPGATSEDEFNDWYDGEHGQARLAVPGVRGMLRYRALDDTKPSWLALYDLDGPEVLDTPAYQAVIAGLSDRDRRITSGLATLERRIYSLLSTDGSAASGDAASGDAASGDPAPVILSVAMSVPAGSQDDMDAWYTQEHIPLLLQVPGWLRIRRYRLIPAAGSSAPDFLSLHELAGPEVLEEPGYRAAISTPWRDRVVGSALRRERRVFGFRNSVG
jgi:hypothetical protein